MRGRVGVVILVLGLFAAGLAAGAIQAGPTAPPATTGDTTTAAPTTTTVAPAPARSVMQSSPIGSGSCLVAGFALQAPDGQALVLGTAAHSRQDLGAHDVAYPADASVVAA